MSEIHSNPKTLVEAVSVYSDEQKAFERVRDRRWPHGVTCPHCGTSEVRFVSTRRIWQCNGCRKQFSCKTGTIFEDSPISFTKWLPAVWMIANCKNGVSSYELARALGVTQKTAWFMLHRIRLAMRTGTFEKLSGRVEADETYIGGKARNMHFAARVKRGYEKTIGGSHGKSAVLGMLERGGRVVARVIQVPDRKTLKKLVMKHVDESATLYTDAHPGYEDLTFHYERCVIEHATEYVRGNVHTNGIENFWSLLKRTIGGTYVSVEPFHLFRYLDEQAFRFNLRKMDDGARFDSVLSTIVGRRLTYKKLIGKELAAGA